MSLAMLLLSLAALAAAPLVYRWARQAGWALAALDGFVLVSIGGLVAAHVLPDVVEEAGFGALLAGLVGLVGPLFLERWVHAAAARVHTAALLVALGGVLAHAWVDGMALATPVEAGNAVGPLALGVVLHRLPVALTIYGLLSRPYGPGRAALALLVLGAGTVGGYVAGAGVVGHEGSVALGYFEAFVAGTLLHVVIHRTTHEAVATVGGWRLAAGLGGLVGLALVVGMSAVVSGEDQEWGNGVGTALLALALESAPALVLAYLASGLVHVLLPKVGVGWLGRGGSFSQAMRGVAFGLPLPMCSCGVVPVYRSLTLQGVPAAAAMGFFVATPELGLDAIFLSLPLLGPEITVARTVSAVVIALVVGWSIGSLVKRGNAPVHARAPGAPPGGALQRLREVVRIGFGEMVDATIPWITLGLVVAALLGPLLEDPSFVMNRVPAAAEVAVFALLGMPAYVCASGATPLVAVLIAHGVSPGAGLAFLLTGPATNVSTFGVLSALHGRTVAVAFGAAIAGLAIILGHGVNLLIPDVVVEPPSHLHVASAAWWQICSLAALCVLLVLSLLRQGPRELVAHIVSAESEECTGECGAAVCAEQAEAPSHCHDCCDGQK